MRTVAILAGSLLATSLLAQDPVDPKPESKPTPEACMQELQDLQQSLYNKYRKAVAEAKQAAEAAKAAGKPVPAMPMRPDFGEVVAKAQEFAGNFAGTDDAIPFLMLVVRQASDKSATRSALDTLLDKHVDSPQLAMMGRMMPYLSQIVDEDFATKALAKLGKSKSSDVRGWALLAAHQDTIENADLKGEDYAKAKAALLAVAESVDDKGLAQQIKTSIDTREKFGIGCTAPDIEGIDLDGEKFKLSDYKGKVIFLDFWGDW